MIKVNCPQCNKIMKRVYPNKTLFECEKCDKTFRAKNTYQVGSGSTVQRLIKKLKDKFKKQYGYDIASIDLYPALGYWRHIKADVQIWTGYIRLENSSLDYNLGSWSTMTNCLKYGFTIDFYDGEFSINHIETMETF